MDRLVFEKAWGQKIADQIMREPIVGGGQV
jgi:hypothetical protein